MGKHRLCLSMLSQRQLKLTIWWLRTHQSWILLYTKRQHFHSQARAQHLTALLLRWTANQACKWRSSFSSAKTIATPERVLSQKLPYITPWQFLHQERLALRSHRVEDTKRLSIMMKRMRIFLSMKRERILLMTSLMLMPYRGKACYNWGRRSQTVLWASRAKDPQALRSYRIKSLRLYQRKKRRWRAQNPCWLSRTMKKSVASWGNSLRRPLFLPGRANSLLEEMPTSKSSNLLP